MKKYLGIIIIVILAFLLRVYGVGSNPPSLSWDEVSIGYNAYSILKTGRDEHGRFMPLDTFVSYGDYKPPVAIYLTVPFVAFMGLTETAVRMPSVLAGSFTILLTYLVIAQLLSVRYGGKKEEDFPSFLRKHAPWMTALVLSLSPWHINLSRGGWEANIALLFIVQGIYLVLKAQTVPKLWYAAFLPFVAALYTFNSARYFAPAFTVLLLILVRKSLLSQKKYVITGIVIAFLALLPIIPHLLSKEARLRFAEVNIFTDPKIVETANRRIEYQGNTYFAKIIHNRRVYYVRSYFQHFMDHFRPDFLFIQGDGNPKFSIREVGQLYWTDAFFLPIGLYVLLLYFPIAGLVSVMWVLLAIAPAAVARETPHALRILNTLPNWQIWTALGILTVVYVLSQKTKIFKQGKILNNIFGFIIISVYFIQTLFYLHNYYVHYPVAYSGEWQYGYREAIRKAWNLRDRYDRIVVSEVIGRPYMYALFYTKYDPAEYLKAKNASFDNAGFYHVYGFDKFVFREDVSGDDPDKTLYVLPPNQIPSQTHVIDTVPLLNGETKLVLFD